LTCQLTFLPVGNADSIVIQTEYSTLLVDLGNLPVLDEWLESQGIHQIERIYITHAHADHLPSLIKLVEFLSNWFEHGTIGKIHLPDKVWRLAKEKVELSRQEQDPNKQNPKIRSLELALNRIAEWNSNAGLKISPIVRDGEEYSKNSLKIQALHPSHIYIENYLALGGGKLNEISLVLQVTYGSFTALLLADVEGNGLTDLLGYLQSVAHRNSVAVNVAKIPHHGAWPNKGDDLRDLLNLVNPELAVLSVGSKNQHNHVRPELFQTLTDMKNTKSVRLDRFVCTEATRTCVHSMADIFLMGKQGLAEVRPCASEITIIAETSGKWSLKTGTDHPAKIASMPYAACAGRLESK
jgi:beta-lactamase superfamily II metal-dependent hydrolase